MTKKRKQKYYVVWKGVNPGIYDNWKDCQLQTKGYEGALYKSFSDRNEANRAFNRPPFDYIGKTSQKSKRTTRANRPPFQTVSLAVDAACSGNPGNMEYRGVDVETGEELFHVGPLAQGTNNIGEFLAIVHGLAYLKKIDGIIPIYSDSRNAMLWIRQKKCNTKLRRTFQNGIIFELIARAEKWLQENTYTTQVLKWKTEEWGENPADFGRK